MFTARLRAAAVDWVGTNCKLMAEHQASGGIWVLTDYKTDSRPEVHEMIEYTSTATVEYSEYC